MALPPPKNNPSMCCNQKAARQAHKSWNSQRVWITTAAD